MDTQPQASYYYTTNLALASALSALGCKERQPDPVTVEIPQSGSNRKPESKFWFEPISPDGTEVSKIVESWESLEWLRKNGTHPLSYVKAAFVNRLTWLRWMDEASPLARYEKGNRVMLLGLKMKPEDVLAYTEKFNQLGGE